MNGNNSQSTTLLVCTVCGMKYQAVTASLARTKRCVCSGELRKVEEKPKEPGK